MQHQIAKELMAILLEPHGVLDKAEALAQRIDDEFEQQRVRRSILKAGGTLYSEVIMEIIREYPDLDPD